MGTMLEALFAGCIPITTRASGVDEEVLDQCLVVDAGRPDQHRAMIHDVVEWRFHEWAGRSEGLQRTARRRHSWTSFDRDVGAALADLLHEERSHENQAIH